MINHTTRNPHRSRFYEPTTGANSLPVCQPLTKPRCPRPQTWKLQVVPARKRVRAPRALPQKMWYESFPVFERGTNALYFAALILFLCLGYNIQYQGSTSLETNRRSLCGACKAKLDAKAKDGSTSSDEFEALFKKKSNATLSKGQQDRKCIIRVFEGKQAFLVYKEEHKSESGGTVHIRGTVTISWVETGAIELGSQTTVERTGAITCVLTHGKKSWTFTAQERDFPDFSGPYPQSTAKMDKFIATLKSHEVSVVAGWVPPPKSG